MHECIYQNHSHQINYLLPSSYNHPKSIYLPSPLSQALDVCDILEEVHQLEQNEF